MNPKNPSSNPSAIVARLREIIVGRPLAEASTQAAAELEQRLEARFSQWQAVLQQQLAARDARLLDLQTELTQLRAATEEKFAGLREANATFVRIAAAARELADQIDPPAPPSTLTLPPR